MRLRPPDRGPGRVAGTARKPWREGNMSLTVNRIRSSLHRARRSGREPNLQLAERQQKGLPVRGRAAEQLRMSRNWKRAVAFMALTTASLVLLPGSAAAGVPLIDA